MKFLLFLVAVFTQYTFSSAGSPAEGMEDYYQALDVKDVDYKNFPYQFTPEVGIPWYMSARSEGYDVSKKIWSPSFIIGHLKKYKRKKFSAPIEQVAYFVRQKEILRTLQRQQPFIRSPASNKVTIAMGGDIMWLRTNWDNFLDEKLRKHLASYDVVLANLETPISKSHKVPSFMPATSVFNSDPGLITSFYKNDNENIFTALSLANNHMFDKGEVGMVETLDVLKDENIKVSGITHNEAHPEDNVIIEKNGIKIGFYAATFGYNTKEIPSQTETYSANVIEGLAPEPDPQENLDRVNLASIAKALKRMDEQKVDFKIISMHWGFEYEFYPTPRTQQVARKIVELGADVIMGHHPHVQQPPEVCFVNDYESNLKIVGHIPCKLSDTSKTKRKALVLYSLGNFASTMMDDLSGFGLIASLELLNNPQTKHIDWTLPKFEWVINRNWKKGWFGGRHRELSLFSNYIGRASNEEATALNKYGKFLNDHVAY